MSKKKPITLKGSQGTVLAIEFIGGPKPYIRIEDEKGVYRGSFEGAQIRSLRAWLKQMEGK